MKESNQKKKQVEVSVNCTARLLHVRVRVSSIFDGDMFTAVGGKENIWRVCVAQFTDAASRVSYDWWLPLFIFQR